MRVTTFCCCFSLKTGCIIISIYYVILSLLLLLTSSMNVSDKNAVTDINDVMMKHPIIRGMLWTFLAIISLHAIVSLVLLVGAMKEIRAIVLIWIIVDIVFLMAIVYGMPMRFYLDPIIMIASIGKRIFDLILGLYFLIMVMIFYCDLKERQNNNAESV